MLEKPQPHEAASSVSNQVTEEDTTYDRETEIERRLALLSPAIEPESEKEAEDASPVLAATSAAVAPEEEAAASVEKDLLAPVTLPSTVTAATPAPTKPAAEAKPKNKSALLARIMAAQERAKNAQLKQESAAPIEQKEPTSIKFETDKMMNALNGISTEKDKQKEELPTISVRPTNLMAKVPTPAAPPPPSFDVFEKQMQMQQNQPVAPPAPVAFAPPVSAPMAPPMMAMAPPSFDAIAPQVFHQQQQHGTAPPQFSSVDADLLGGVMPLAPPPPAEMNVSAPSFDQVMQQQLHSQPQQQHHEEDFHLDLDEDGMQMSPEAKRKMIEEQRAIMEHIEKQARNNKASEMAVKADAFANRMANAGVHSSSRGGNTMAASVDGFSSSEVEEQRKILAQIEAEKNKGTAIPTEFMTQEEIYQMEEDRRMAERLQAEENAVAGEDGASEYPGNRSASSTAAVASAAGGKTWWDSMNDALVSVGVTSPPEPDHAQQSVSRPPGSSRVLHSAVTGEEGTERVGLLGGEDGRPAARVAESQPLFSCIVDSVSNTAAVVGNTIMGEDDEDEVNGVDTTSFLAVPNTGRDRNEGGGNYFAIPPSD